ncbi:hypothetical protein BAUCODRAFT_66991 [Baudoinia panamericana UAMH 10762]|uniref:Cyclin N-terminal domain-containing protein n=1 Tax=Baudoinia panamericana (strain UAMH 10762) TaxID=717646 RepID=M2N1W5_BAUPA|nr:uncharacterized protein BAUCODRAFT_66991 [Baudoinia panamericana UAMH 10762]EMC97918.1 hypothetical protein BAUCODRAFT_66991 [Baudoinia panamericana UAMH 10762]
MNGVAHTTSNSRPSYSKQENGYHYGDHAPSQQAYTAAVAPYLPQVAHTSQHRAGPAAQASSRPLSPVSGPRQPVFDDGSSSMRSSQANAIAPSFQIPKSVNDSGGSLSVLAAQITCLFWFESADVLQAVEDAPIGLQPSRALVLDAKPTTGFLKWVTTILSTTLVAQNVVILALLFIYRLKKLNPTVKGKPGSEYRLLTVALMLGNKFLDDNTYTNKTWAEVSGIVVAEVHIMEVEFLSNMKYCLFTSADDWARWQSLLGKFAAFFENATRPQPPANRPAPILPPSSSLYLPAALPSPPFSNQASPPYSSDVAQPAYGGAALSGITPVPSPLARLPQPHSAVQNRRKRSHEDQLTEPPAKRIASGSKTTAFPSTYATTAGAIATGQQAPRLTLPSLMNPATTSPARSQGQASAHLQQLPPLNVPARAMAMVYPPASSFGAGPLSQPPSQLSSQYQSRQHSPYPGSAADSPADMAPSSAVSLQPLHQISPTYFLQQRNSPYRPVQNFSTLLYPPPSSALHQRPHPVEHAQMHYQPLAKSGQQLQSGRLPYIAQNVWLNGDQHQPMTPIHQWPSFANARQQHVPPQQ